MKYRRKHLVFLKNNVNGRSYKDLCNMFNKKFNTELKAKTIQETCKRYGMFNGLDGRFKKGHIPANKGLKGVGGHPPTYFQKGHIPKNYKPVGSERISVDGYIEVKIAEPNIWKPKHKVLWQGINGNIPHGHVVVFADGDRKNLNINNLVLVSRAELLYLNRNKLIFKDADLTKISAKVAKVANLMFTREKSELVCIIKKFLKENKISCFINKSTCNTYIYFMGKYSIRISDHLPQSSIKTTFNLGSHQEADGDITSCKKWVLKILKKMRSVNGAG